MSAFSTIVFAFLALFQLFIDATSTFPPIPPNQILSISKDVSVYVPWQYCLPENCPPSLGTCNHETNTCEFIAPFKGLATHPEAYATQYCELAPTGCLGVTYVNTPYNTAKNIGQTFNLPLCGETTTGQKCVGMLHFFSLIISLSKAHSFGLVDFHSLFYSYSFLRLYS